jgi:biopolymer transport protein TolR
MILRGRLIPAALQKTMPQLAKHTQTSLSEINMVPFVDVVLVLLIIFMITAPILQSGIEVDVPKTHTVKEITEQRLVITIDKTQRVYLGNEAVNIHQLGQKVHAQLKRPQDAVFLRCDETVPFGSFATIVDELRQSGISNISIVTEPIADRSRTH